jgi:hypothetical protein
VIVAARKMIVTVLLAGALVFLAAFGWARAQVLIPRAEDVRFELLTQEPIAGPDHRSVVAGWYALVVKDRRTGKCYIALTQGNEMAMAPGECGP